MRLIVGLGNIGTEYTHNRHNAGFIAADQLIRRYGVGSEQKKFQGLVTTATSGDEQALILKPTTFMNLSGQAVGQAAHFYKIKPEDVFVLHDDLDLPFGTIKIKQGGGSAGHNGLKSIDSAIGNTYWRLRFGIGHPAPEYDVADYVLSNFTRNELQDLEKMTAYIAEHFAEILQKPQDAHMLLKRENYGI